MSTEAVIKNPDLVLEDMDVIDLRIPVQASESGVIDLRARRTSRVQRFSVMQEASSVEAAFVVAVEGDRWNTNNGIALKRSFVIANKPKGVAADHFVRWIEAIIEDPASQMIPDHHRPAVLQTAQVYSDAGGPAVAIPCSWSETTDHLFHIGHQIRRGKRRPKVFRFIGVVPAR